DIRNGSIRLRRRGLLREKVLLNREEEVPHSINVVIDSRESKREHKHHIQATIITERPPQIVIVIIQGGRMVKRIGREARRDIEQLLDEKVYVELWVKVQKDWRNKQSALNQFGFNELDE